jgi:Na+-driven multidrug efflux pump
MNGAGIIKLQLFVAALGAILNIPLSVIFAKYCDMGIFGIKLATLLCAMLTSIAMPIQAIIYLKRNTSKKEKLK